MPTLHQAIGNGICVADYRGSQAVLFDTTTPRWWVVETEVLRAATTNPSDAVAFANRLRSAAQAWAGSNPDETSQPQFYVIYKLTDKCNFSCTYCYDRNFTRKRDAERRNRTVRDYLSRLNTDHPHAVVNVLFHGGEPLLEFDEISELLTFGSTLDNLLSLILPFNQMLR